MSGNRSMLAFFDVVGYFECIFQREGGIAHQPLLVSDNQSDCRFVRYQNIRCALFSFVTIHASDGRTDRHTDRQTHGQTDRRTDRRTDRIATAIPCVALHAVAR